VRVLPGEQRRAARDARQRAGVVPLERHAVLVEPLGPRQRARPPGGQLGTLVGRRRPLLVGEDEDHVRWCAHQPAFRSRYEARPSSIESPAWPSGSLRMRAPTLPFGVPPGSMTEDMVTKVRPSMSAFRSQRLVTPATSGGRPLMAYASV